MFFVKLNHAAGYVTGSRYRVVDEYSCVAELTKPNFFCVRDFIWNLLLPRNVPSKNHC